MPILHRDVRKWEWYSKDILTTYPLLSNGTPHPAFSFQCFIIFYWFILNNHWSIQYKREENRHRMISIVPSWKSHEDAIEWINIDYFKYQSLLEWLCSVSITYFYLVVSPFCFCMAYDVTIHYDSGSGFMFGWPISPERSLRGFRFRTFSWRAWEQWSNGWNKIWSTLPSIEDPHSFGSQTNPLLCIWLPSCSSDHTNEFNSKDVAGTLANRSLIRSCSYRCTCSGNLFQSMRRLFTWDWFSSAVHNGLYWVKTMLFILMRYFEMHPSSGLHVYQTVFFYHICDAFQL